MRNDPGRTGAVATGQVTTNATNAARWAPPRPSPRDPVDMALAAIGFGIDLRDVVRRLDELLGGAP
jgi:hypothetical protein